MKGGPAQRMFGTSANHLDRVPQQVAAGKTPNYHIVIETSLGSDIHSLAVALHTHGTRLVANFARQEIVLIFNVLTQDRSDFEGTFCPPVRANCEDSAA